MNLYRPSILFVLVVFALLGVIATVSAQENANKVTDFACRITLVPLGGTQLITTDTFDVTTANGITTFFCRADIPEHLIPKKAIKVKGIGCTVRNQNRTTNVENLYTPSGQAILKCQINPSQ